MPTLTSQPPQRSDNALRQDVLSLAEGIKSQLAPRSAKPESPAPSARDRRHLEHTPNPVLATLIPALIRAVARAQGAAWANAEYLAPPDSNDALTPQQSRDLDLSLDKFVRGRPLPIDLGEIYEMLLDQFPAQPGALAAGTTRSDRNACGSFYTPEPLVEHLLDSALEPVISEHLAPASNQAEALLELRLCDPACGSGRFLVAAGARLADRLAVLRAHPKQPSLCQHRRARRDVFQRCLFGVDLDPLAVEICRFNLSLAANDPALAPSAFEGQVRIGNALLWTTPDRASANQLDSRLVRDRWCAERIHNATHPDAPFTEDEITRLCAQHRFFHWDLEFPAVFRSTTTSPAGFDAVLGNPPFLNQLETATQTAAALAPLIRDLFGGAVSGYADLSNAFLLLAKQIAAPAGRIALVMPQSFLAARDAAPIRRRLLDGARLESLWIYNERVFPGVSVHTCAPTLCLAPRRRGLVQRHTTGTFRELDPIEIDADELAAAPTWSHLGAAAMGIPEAQLKSDERLADCADATADFRDQYYGLAGFIIESEDIDPAQQDDFEAYPPIVTTGLIDLAVCRWGAAQTRLHKRRWTAPRIDRRRMERDGALAPWITARLVPKLILATQTRVMEVIVDAQGRYVPSVPLITVTPKAGTDLWMLAAALASPVITAYALRHHAGAALHSDAIKLSAAQTLDLPLPTDRTSWKRAAKLFRQASDEHAESKRHYRLRAFGALSCKAYGLSKEETDSMMLWWAPRLQGKIRRTPTTSGASSDPP